MMRLSSIIKTFESRFLDHYQEQILPSHRKALAAMSVCRTNQSPRLRAGCSRCDHTLTMPHSCGHRHCPHCQNHESQQWLKNQLQKRVPAAYFLLTFTLPAEFRPLAWCHQRQLYALMIQCVWETVRTFAQNDKQLWRTKGGKTRKNKNRKPYLFSHKALAKMFRGKLLDAITDEGLMLPASCSSKWVVDCRSVGSGEKALVYLGRYLYRWVIQEKDIVSCQDGKVTFRYQDSKTKKWVCRTVPEAKFLWLVLRQARETLKSASCVEPCARLK